MTLRLRYAALSDVGRVRQDNQDSGFASEHLLVVADGVGGAARGDIASSTAVAALRRLDGPPPPDLLEALAGAVQRASDKIGELVQDEPDLAGTSTTVTAALFDATRIGVGHVGDSRAYLLRDGVLRQLTRDHTFVQSLVDEGRITEEESRSHPHRNLILRAVDGVHDAEPDLFLVDVAAGDRILLCSDGCSGVLEPDRLAELLASGTVDYAAVDLVRAALEAGSNDNVTCVVAEVVPQNQDENRDTSAAVATGPMLVGAAADQPRRAGWASNGWRRLTGGDTDEIQPVPGEHPPQDPEELRYAPRPPRRSSWVRRALLLLVLVVVVVVALVVGYRWTQQQYYVAAAGSDVAIYRGVQADIPGLTLSSVFEQTRVALSTLPAYRAGQVRDGIQADDLADARDIVARLGDLVPVCPEPSPSAAPRTAASTPPRTAPGKSPASTGPRSSAPRTPIPRTPGPGGPTSAGTPQAQATPTDCGTALP